MKSHVPPSMRPTMTGLLQGSQHDATAREVHRAYDMLIALQLSPQANKALRLDKASANDAALHRKTQTKSS